MNDAALKAARANESSTTFECRYISILSCICGLAAEFRCVLFRLGIVSIKRRYVNHREADVIVCFYATVKQSTPPNGVNQGLMGGAFHSQSLNRLCAQPSPIAGMALMATRSLSVPRPSPRIAGAQGA